MEETVTTISVFFTTMWQAISTSVWFFAFKVLAAIYTAVLLVDVILLIYLGDARKRLRQLRRGTNRIIYGPHKVKKLWNGIRKRLENDDEAQWKLAVLEADHLIDKELAQQGYHGDNFAERLAQIPEHAFSILPAVREAHAVRNHIIKDEDYELTHEEAKKTVKTFEQFLEDLGVGTV